MGAKSSKNKEEKGVRKMGIGNNGSPLLSECSQTVESRAAELHQESIVAHQEATVAPAIAEGPLHFQHHLFLAGSRLPLALGQEPFASFNCTKIKIPASQSASSAGTPRQSMSLIPQDQAKEQEVDLVLPAGDGTLTGIGPSPAMVIAHTLQTALRRQPRCTATVIISALDGAQSTPQYSRSAFMEHFAQAPPGTTTTPSSLLPATNPSPSPSATPSDLNTPLGGSPSGGSPDISLSGKPLFNPSLQDLTAAAMTAVPTICSYPPAPSLSTTSMRQPILPMGVVLSLIEQLRALHPSIFIILWHPHACEDAALRQAAFSEGANMVTYSLRDLSTALTRIVGQGGSGNISCDWCGLSYLSPADYYLHQPLYHIYEANKGGKCQVCHEEVPNLAVHVHEMHAPGGPRPEIRTCAGSVVVVHRKEDNKFLMVQEFAGQGFWVPGGGNEPGESLSSAAVREVYEETGVKIELEGLLELKSDMMYKPLPWRLAVFYGVPKPGVNGVAQKPKTVPDFESAGACWVDADLLPHIPLRSPDIPLTWMPRVAAGTHTLLPIAIPPEYAHNFSGLQM